jgi:hypothetical protein
LPSTEERDREWLIPCAIIAVVEVSLLWAAHRGGYVGPPELFAYAWLAFPMFLLVGACLFFTFIVRLAIAGQSRPLRSVVEAARVQWPRLLTAFIGLLIITISEAAFTGLKVAIPAVSPFWLDLPLARAEASLGIAPWEATHALLGWATSEIDLIYWSWFFVLPTVLYLLLWSKPSLRKSQALLAFALITFLLGVVAACLLSSVGPIFYDRIFGGSTFAALTADVSQRAPRMMLAQQILWNAYSSHALHIGNGISAMPSIHVAISMWLVLVAKGTRFRIPAIIYLGLIWIGSVHLGWHYASDGLVAIVGVLLVWKLARVLITPGFGFVADRALLPWSGSRGGLEAPALASAAGHASGREAGRDHQDDRQDAGEGDGVRSAI